LHFLTFAVIVKNIERIFIETVTKTEGSVFFFLRVSATEITLANDPELEILGD